MRPVPAWLKSRCEHWRDVLRLKDWDIRVEIATNPKKGENLADAQVHVRGWLNKATITFRADKVKRGAELDQTIIHEMLHIKMARSDDYVTEFLIPALPEAARSLAVESYRHLVEPMVDSLSRIIHTPKPPK